MVGHPRDFTHNHADVLTAVGHLEVKKLFRRQREPNIINQRRDVVQPVGIRNNVVPGALLAHLLKTTMQIADFDIAVEDLLAIELEPKLNGAVRSGMGGSHLQGHDLGRRI